MTQPRKTAIDFALEIVASHEPRRDSDLLVEAIAKALDLYLLQESGELVKGLEYYAEVMNWNREDGIDGSPMTIEGLWDKAEQSLNTFRSRHKQLWLGSQEKEQQ